MRTIIEEENLYKVFKSFISTMIHLGYHEEFIGKILAYIIQGIEEEDK